MSENKELKLLQGMRYQFKAKDLKNFFEKIYLFVDSVNIKATSKGLVSLDMEPSNVLMFHRILQSVKTDGFSQDHQEVEFVEFNLPIKRLNAFLKKVCVGNMNEIISLLFTDTHMHLTGFFGDYRVPFYLDVYPRKEPELEFKAQTTLKASQFYKELSYALAAGSKKISFASSEGWLNLSDEDTFKKGEKVRDEAWTHEKVTRTDAKEDCKSVFSLEFLKLPFFDKDKNLKIEFGHDYPLKITDPEGNFIILAPRVEC